MDGTVLITTHALERAGSLRELFRGAGYEVRLVTVVEDLDNVEVPVLLILTGSLDAPAARVLSARARELRLPVFGIFDDPDSWRGPARQLGLAESFVPPTDLHEVLLLGRRLIERRRLQEVTGIVGETDRMREALERVVQIAPVDSTVLVTGESGTGKELVARGIHALSPRRHKPFIAVNVAALSETLLESELFGHEKGAFTGAIDSRRGFFELAHAGTIFLDEIGEMPLQTQTKLLRVLEQREFLRVGGEKAIHVDVRIITATNQDLRRLVAIGDFRRDLYYRLNVLRIELPPLRNRREDIPRLVDAFVREVSALHDRPFVGISPEAMEILQSYDWPGNVRELRNLVESMVVLAPGTVIRPDDIPEEVRAPRAGSILLPAPVPDRPAPSTVTPSGGLRPELEFVFRTLVELRVDMDELRREFEAYREQHRGEEGMVRRLPLGTPGAELHVMPVPSRTPETPRARGREGWESWVEPSPVSWGSDPATSPGQGTVGTGAPVGAEPEEENLDGQVVVFRPGMSMDDMEREAISAALRAVGGNRRQAAQALGIGERTLYRKIKKYGLDD